MSVKSKIEWTESTWNPITGCTKISEGCKNCYAERLAKRLQAMGQVNYSNGFAVTIHPNTLTIPLQWKKSRMIFVNSMSDLFHESVPDDYIFSVFEVMNTANWHIFQVLTKRSDRLMSLSPKLYWSPNIWVGVSVENQRYAYRIDDLRSTNAKCKFISFEPLIGPIDNVDLIGIDWVIVGGESGPQARVMRKEWVIKIRDYCISNNIPFFFKQWGGVNKCKSGRVLEGKIWNEQPYFAVLNAV